MLMPDLDRARRFVEHTRPPGEVIVCGITGSHFYGFPSADSDVDMKGIHVAPLRAMLGLNEPPPTHDRLEIFEGVEHDLTTHEAKKALSLLLRGNGNMLERILTPIQLYESEDLNALRALAQGAVAKRFFPHYRGFLTAMKREHEKSDAPRAKKLLYAYRVALTGAHLMLTGELRGDVIANADEHGISGVRELVQHKAEHGEKCALDPALDAEHRARWPALEALLVQSFVKSPLPEDPPNAAAMDAWLIDRRLARPD
jgi:predicted nucleotidyltransferase